MIENYPAIKRHLDSFGDKLTKRADQGDTPYNLRNCAYLEDFSKPKIVYREIGLEMDACMVPANWFINNKLYMITGEGLENLILFLNSNICNKICLKAANITGGKGVDFMQEIRVPKLNYQLQSERELYDLYGFTVEEIEYLDNE